MMPTVTCMAVQACNIVELKLPNHKHAFASCHPGDDRGAQEDDDMADGWISSLEEAESHSRSCQK